MYLTMIGWAIAEVCFCHVCAEVQDASRHQGIQENSAPSQARPVDSETHDMDGGKLVIALTNLPKMCKPTVHRDQTPCNLINAQATALAGFCDNK